MQEVMASARPSFRTSSTLGRERGWSRLYWHTRASNETARRLYDKFVNADDFVRYRMILG